MDRLKKVFRSAESEEPEQDLYILTLCRHRPRKETFPDSYNYDLARCSRGVSPQDEVSDSFHWLMDFETSSRDPEADWEEEEGEECRRRQYDIVKQRRKFAITRSKSFAQPVSKFVNTDERVEAGRKKYSQQLPRVQNNKVVRKKSLVFKTPEIESNERDGKQEEARAKRILTFHSLDEVLQDHLRAIEQRWHAMDDEVWAKIVVMEKESRLAKAYIKTPVVGIDGSNAGFDGVKVGINGLASGVSGDKESAMCKLLIEEGCRLKLTQNGDILMKRDDNLNIFAFRSKYSKQSMSDVIVRLPYGLMQKDKTYKLFDMKKFQDHLSQELLTERPDWSSLEKEAAVMFSFAKFTEDIIQAPVWIVIINIVALQVIKTLRDSTKF